MDHMKRDPLVLCNKKVWILEAPEDPPLWQCGFAQIGCSHEHKQVFNPVWWPNNINNTFINTYNLKNDDPNKEFSKKKPPRMVVISHHVFSNTIFANQQQEWVLVTNAIKCESKEAIICKWWTSSSTLSWILCGTKHIRCHQLRTREGRGGS